MQAAHIRDPAKNANNRAFPWDHLKIARTLLDPEALEILGSSSTTELTALELSRRCGMSIGRCYRWLRRLESLGLLVSREGPPERSGVHARRYRSALQSMHVSLEEDRIRTRVEVNEGSTPLVSECMTMIDSVDVVDVPEALARRHKDGTQRVHFVDPPTTTHEARYNLPIDLPAFLKEPLSRLLERR
jgi:DNA-binding transcriptional ArsR family regulator